jgi:hypothetical protein
MAQTITNNTRTEAVKTVSSHYFFNIGGTFSSNTFALEWSEDGTTWYPIKDSTDADLTRTAASNGVVTTGINGFLSGVVASGSGHTLSLSLIPV